MDQAVDQVIERFTECQVLVGEAFTTVLLPSPDGEWVRYWAVLGYVAILTPAWAESGLTPPPTERGVGRAISAMAPR